MIEEVFWESGDEEGVIERIRSWEGTYVSTWTGRNSRFRWQVGPSFKPPELEGVQKALEIVQSQLLELRQSLEFAEDLRQRLTSGSAVILDVEPYEFPDFSEEEIESCKAKILQEIDAERRVFTSDISEKYDLDYALVALCSDQLAEEGVIGEVQRS